MKNTSGFASSHIKGRGTWEIMNFEERRENLTEGEKWFVLGIFIQLYTITFTKAGLNFKEFVIIFCQVLASPPVRVCRRLTILSARDPKFDERLRDLLPSPAYFHSYWILYLGLIDIFFWGRHIFSPAGFSILVSFGIFFFCIFSLLLDFLSLSLLGFSPTGKAETFLCNHALFIHLVIKKRPNH